MMPTSRNSEIRAIVFDLDGTLYVSDEFAATIQDQAAVYIADILGVSIDEARREMAATRQRLTGERGTVQTLSRVCSALGGSTPDLHRHFRQHLRPEAYLQRDERVIALLERLGRRFSLYLYTNNNSDLALRIMSHLGLDGRFVTTYTIDDGWRSKPDQLRLEQVLREIGLPPAGVLFVGDRYDVDLALPEQQGCPVYLSQTIDQLLRLDAVLSNAPR
jgi:putative hydrolase of the HAD superfamily